MYQLPATSLNSGRCGLFLNGRTKWLLIPHWQICMIIWNICLRWEFYILKLSFFKNITLFSVVWIEIETVLNRNPCSFCCFFLKMASVYFVYIFCECSPLLISFSKNTLQTISLKNYLNSICIIHNQGTCRY